MAKGFDVAVIGGGITGLSTAYHLLKSGKRVLLIEKNHIGAGASSACDDMILLQSKKPGISLQMAFESLEMYKRLSAELGYNVEFETRGGMILIENNYHLHVMEEYVKQQKSYGLDVHIIDQKEVRRRQPNVRDGIVASTFSDKDSQVNPLKVMRGFMRKGLSMGLEIKQGAVIKEMNPLQNGWRLTLEDGQSIETEYVINAAGAWAPQVGKIIGIDIPITPKRGQIAVTEQIPSIGETNVWSAEYIVSKLKPDTVKAKNDTYKNLGIGFAFSQTANGNCLIGSTRENVGFDRETSVKALKILINQAVSFFPILKNVHIIRSFAGLRPGTSDGKPIICEVKNRKGFYIAAGHEGDGIALAPITGKLISDMINGRSITYNMKEVDIKRFESVKDINTG